MAHGLLSPDDVRRALVRALEANHPAPGPPFPCPYLPDRLARHVTLVPSPLLPGVYGSLMDLNFRRSGPVFYRPACQGCSECRMLRLPVRAFRPSRAQRRAWARNQDLVVRVGRPLSQVSEEKRRLYARYLEARHDGQMAGSREELEAFLYRSPIRTLEVEYRHHERLLAVGIADLEPQALSAVYCYFDPDTPARSLGVFNVLFLIEECRRRELAHLYLGYFVAGSPVMAYKAGYRPSEVLGADGHWERLAFSPVAGR
jgi:arginine-tRNA-protein transferase